jgi:hypothetical protein
MTADFLQGKDGNYNNGVTGNTGKWSVWIISIGFTDFFCFGQPH